MPGFVVAAAPPDNEELSSTHHPECACFNVDVGQASDLFVDLLSAIVSGLKVEEMSKE